MTAATVLDEVRRLGVGLAADGERLRVRAPAGVMTPDLRSALAEHKAGVLALLVRPDRDVLPPLPDPADWRDDLEDRGPFPTPMPWRDVVARWSIPDRERWGRLANDLEDEGMGWREAEQEAFRRVESVKDRPEPPADQPTRVSAEHAPDPLPNESYSVDGGDHRGAIRPRATNQRALTWGAEETAR